MEIKRSGAQASGRGPAEYFTGTVRIDPLFEAPDPARVRGASVTFEPGARTAWHTHPLGQTLIVTVRARVGAALGRPDRGDPAGRRGVVRARREALARGDAADGDDAHRGAGGVGRECGRVAGARQRRAVRRVTGEQDRGRLFSKRRYIAKHGQQERTQERNPTGADGYVSRANDNWPCVPGAEELHDRDNRENCRGKPCITSRRHG